MIKPCCTCSPNKQLDSKQYIIESVEPFMHDASDERPHEVACALTNQTAGNLFIVHTQVVLEVWEGGAYYAYGKTLKIIFGCNHKEMSLTSMA